MKKRIIAFILMLTCLCTLVFQKADIAQAGTTETDYDSDSTIVGTYRWGRVDQSSRAFHDSEVTAIKCCSYTDVQKSHWAYKYICLAESFNIMCGIGNAQFGNPDSNIQYGDFLRALSNTRRAFYNRSISDPVNSPEFNIAGSITRADAIYKLWIDAGYPYDDSIKTDYLYDNLLKNYSNDFKTEKDIEFLNKYNEAIGWSLSNNILSGSTDGELHLNDPLTRGQAAKILVEYYLYLNKEYNKRSIEFTWYYFVDIDDSVGNTKSDKIVFAGEYNLNESLVSRSGYTLKGWNLYRPVDDTWYVDGEGWFSEDTILAKNYTKATYSPTTSIKFDSNFIDEIKDSKTVTSFTFYAVWEKTYNININANGGYSNKSTTELELNGYISLKKSFVSRTGYTLKGWNLYRPVDRTWYVDGKGWYSESAISANKYTKATYSPTTSIKLDSKFFDGIKDRTTVTSFTFYAVWEKTTYNIKIKNNGCYEYRSTMNVKFGDYIYLYKSLVSRSGYTLKGWNLYRPTDKTWYVNGNWYSTATILARNYSKTTYSPTTSIKLDERFFKGVSDSTTVTSFVVYPVWEKNTLFADVPTYHWAYNYIYKADALGIMVGVGSNKFEPDSYIQKNNFYAVLNRVSSWKYYSNSYTSNISRNEAVYLFWENACGEPLIKYSANNISSSRVWYYINNSSDIYGIYKNYGYNYAKAWAWCIDNKIISGTGNGNYEPYRSITRAETARIFVDYYNILY